MEIFGTLGPSLLTESKLNALVDAGVTILRINGAHSDGPTTRRMIETVRGFIGERARVMVDLPTNKVRVANLSEPIVFGAGDRFEIHGFQLNYPPLCALVRVGVIRLRSSGATRSGLMGNSSVGS